MNKEKFYKCPEEGCHASYTKRCRLEVHLRKHTGERPFVCDVEDCGKSYTNVSHLKRHKCLVHENTEEVVCPHEGCGQVLNNIYNLKKHKNRYHNAANYAFTCSECSQGFKRKQELHHHMYLHTGQPTFKCSICNSCFLTKHLYNKHKICHKTYPCDCGATFDRWTLYLKHRRDSCSIPKIEYKCIICNKKFYSKANLKMHSLVHLDESHVDTYRCPYLDCKRNYKYKRNLMYHIAAFHEKKNGKTVKCDEPGCDAVLKSKQNLKRHKLKLHSGIPQKKKKLKTRKDKGKPKKSMASTLSGIKLPIKEDTNVIKNSNAIKEDTNIKNVSMVNNPSSIENTTDNANVTSLLNENMSQAISIGTEQICPLDLIVQIKNEDLISIETPDDINCERSDFIEQEEKLKQKFVAIVNNHTQKAMLNHLLYMLSK